MKIISYPSQNFDLRPKNTDIDTIVLHYTGMPDFESAISRLCEPESKVSSHYVINENGDIYSLVDDKHRAWHSGKSYWHGKDKINDNSIGVELANPGHEFGYRDFTKAQMESLVGLCKIIMKNHPIEDRNIVAHSDIAPLRKEDPGELFDWKYLADNGIGIWPVFPKSFSRHIVYSYGAKLDEIFYIQSALSDYGYNIKIDGVFGRETESVIKAFQRHFLQDHVDGIWDSSSELAITQLLLSI